MSSSSGGTGQHVKYKPKKHYSDFLITVNTNFKPAPNTGEAEYMFDRLQNTMKDVFENNTEKIIQFPAQDHHGNPLPPANYYDNVKSVDVEFVLEIGNRPRGGRIHSHATVKVVHDAYIRMDRKAIHEMIMARLGFNFHLDIKATSVQHKYVEDYLRKTGATVSHARIIPRRR